MSIPTHPVPRQKTALQIEKLERRHSVIEDHDGCYDACNIVQSLPNAGRGIGSIRTRRKEEWSDILPHQTVRILDETPEEETKIVTDIDSVPECTSQERDHRTTEAGFLPFGSDALVHAVSQPYVGVDVPAIEQDLEVGCKFDVHYVYVGSPIP